MVKPRSSFTTLSEASTSSKENHGYCSVVCSQRHLSQLFECGEIVTAEKSCQQIDEMCQTLLRISPRFVNRNGPIPLHYNARAHVAQPILMKLNEFAFQTLPHPACSADFSPMDYQTFNHLDNYLCDKCLTTKQNTKNPFTAFEDSREKNFYLSGINKLISLRQKCIDCDGFYHD